MPQSKRMRWGELWGGFYVFLGVISLTLFYLLIFRQSLSSSEASLLEEKWSSCQPHHRLAPPPAVPKIAKLTMNGKMLWESEMTFLRQFISFLAADIKKLRTFNIKFVHEMFIEAFPLGILFDWWSFVLTWTTQSPLLLFCPLTQHP